MSGTKGLVLIMPDKKEYVERDKVIQVLEKYGTSNGSSLGHHSGAVDCVVSEIEMLPAARVREIFCGTWKVVWVDTGHLGMTKAFVCSVCGGRVSTSKYPNCPWCAASMNRKE